MFIMSIQIRDKYGVKPCSEMPEYEAVSLKGFGY